MATPKSGVVGLASSSEARLVLDRVHVMLLAVVTADPDGESDQE